MRGGSPCGSPAKHPHGRLVPRGLLDATLDEPTIRQWFTAAPLAGLGVATDKLVVLDIDPRHDGDLSLRALEDAHEPLVHTWRSITGGGGDHIIFAAPDNIEVSSFAAGQMSDPPLGRGVDVRARGGYIVAPPSRHINGRTYEWSVDHHPADTPLALPPSWLVEKLACRNNSNNTVMPVPSAEWERIVTGPITAYQDIAAARIAGHLLRRWVNVHVVVALMRAWNCMHCIPPMTDGELMSVINRIANKEADRLISERAK
jgi:hypothetical protein